MHFVLFSLAGATLILLLVFKSWVAIPIILTTVFTANIISLGIMALLGASFTVLSTTVPILVTITVVAISTHSLVRLSDDDDESSDRIQFILKTMKGLAGPHMLTALTTMIGFGTLILSQVQIIREYGLTITCVIQAAALLTLIMLPK